MKKNLLIVFSLLFLSACTHTPPSSAPSPTTTPTAAIPSVALSPSNNLTPTMNQPVIKLTTSKGTILIKLYPEAAPKTVQNILAKADSGHYNGLTFHRVEPGFVIQGGDPLGNGTGGGSITSEINSLPFKRGSVGLARGGNRQISNDSQFYICLATDTCSHLTGEYVNFGEVIEGMDVVDKIRVGDTITGLTQNTK